MSKDGFCYVCNIPLYKGYESFTGLCIKHNFQIDDRIRTANKDAQEVEE